MSWTNPVEESGVGCRLVLVLLLLYFNRNDWSSKLSKLKM